MFIKTVFNLVSEFARIAPRMELKAIKVRDEDGKPTGATVTKEVLANPEHHPRRRIGKTRKEWERNPNKEADRKDRQWRNAVKSAKWGNSKRHK